MFSIDLRKSASNNFSIRMNLSLDGLDTSRTMSRGSVHYPIHVGDVGGGCELGTRELRNGTALTNASDSTEPSAEELEM